jgi:hypothetical protein
MMLSAMEYDKSHEQSWMQHTVIYVRALRLEGWV